MKVLMIIRVELTLCFVTIYYGGSAAGAFRWVAGVVMLSNDICILYGFSGICPNYKNIN